MAPYPLRYLLLILIPLINYGILYSQPPTQTIRGKVIDQASHQPLIGAEVVVLGTSPLQGTTTDSTGHFKLKDISIGRYDIKFNYLGYKKKVHPNIQVTAGKEVVLEVSLQEKIYTTKEIEVTAEKDKKEALNELAPVSARQFTVEETNRFAGTRTDPSRMVSNYAGVTTANDARNDIIVRGNSPVGVLWRLEGFDIPNPNHFSTQGATGGPISILNNNLLDNSDFFSGAFPAEYGNRTAAVFDLQMREGNNQQMEYTGQVGINGFEVGVEGPISKKQGSSFLIHYRYSTLEVFDMLGIRFGPSGIPRYQDLSFKVNLPTTNYGNFSLIGVGGKSDIQLLDSEQDSTDWTFTSSGEDIIYGSDMGMIGLKHSFSYSSDLYGKGGIALSASNFRIQVDTFGAARQDKFTTYENTSVEGKASAYYTLTKKFNAQHTLQGGIRFQRLFFDYEEKYFHRGYNTYIDLLHEEGGTYLLQSHLHWKYRLTEKLTLNNGLHYQHFTLNNSQMIEPRAGLEWELHPHHQLSAGYGLHSQTQPLLFYFMEFYDPQRREYLQPNDELGFTKSHHFVAGYDYSISRHLRLKTEVYYQHLYDVPVKGDEESYFSMLNVGTDLEGMPHVDSLVNKGTGNNYGIELTLEKFFSEHYYFLITGSLYKSQYTGSDDIQRPTNFDGRYTLNLLGGYEVPLGGADKVLGINIKYALAGGNRYIPIDLEASRQAGQTVYKEEEAYKKQFKPYSRLDLKADFQFEHKNITQSWFVTVENVLDRKNVLRRVFVPETGKIKTDYQLGLFPYGGYRINF